MVSYWIANCLINASIIEAKDRNIYEYSIKSLLGNILNIVSCFLIGVLCGEIIRSLVFLLIMVPLRSTIGGCHLKSPFLCFLASCGIVIVCILAPDYIYNVPIIIYTLGTMLWLVITAIIAPVDCIEKPMTKCEKDKMNMKAKWVVGLIAVIYIVLLLLGIQMVCIEIFLAISYALTTLTIEITRKKRL